MNESTNTSSNRCTMIYSNVIFLFTLLHVAKILPIMPILAVRVVDASCPPVTGSCEQPVQDPVTALKCKGNCFYLGECEALQAGFDPQQCNTVAIDSFPPVVSCDDKNLRGENCIQTASPSAAPTADFLKFIPAEINGAAGDLFGHAVSISGTKAIVGSYRHGDKGAVYIFRQTSEGEWVQIAKLVASDGALDDNFGYAVAIDGDTAVVGSFLDDETGTNSGSAYIFQDTPDDGWTQVAKLTAGDKGGASAYFGRAVSVSGTTVIVGAYQDDDAGTNSGSAYIFEQDQGDGTWELVAHLFASDGASPDYFGRVVDISGTTAIVGAYRDDSNQGSAYIFQRDEVGSWGELIKLTASDGDGNDRFGFSVAIDGTTAIVGSYNDEHPNGYLSGSAYIFQQDEGGSWGEVAKLDAADGASSDYFGVSVDIDGTTAVIGVYNDDDNGFNSGSAYIFQDTQNGWTEVAKLTAGDGATLDQFGVSVAISGTTVLVGSYKDDDQGEDSGSVYVFEVDTPTV